MVTGLDADLRELQRIRRLQDTLAKPAECYEEVAEECNGECAEPKWLAPLLTCCACKIISDIVEDAFQLEKLVRKRIEHSTPATPPRVNYKREMLGSLALARTNPRKHSPTFVGRMKDEAAEKLRQLRAQFADLDDKNS